MKLLGIILYKLHNFGRIIEQRILDFISHFFNQSKICVLELLISIFILKFLIIVKKQWFAQMKTRLWFKKSSNKLLVFKKV